MNTLGTRKKLSPETLHEFLNVLISHFRFSILNNNVRPKNCSSHIVSDYKRYRRCCRGGGDKKSMELPANSSSIRCNVNKSATKNAWLLCWKRSTEQNWQKISNILGSWATCAGDLGKWRQIHWCNQLKETRQYHEEKLSLNVCWDE